ncbi:Uncharacterised protein [Stutzerimonas stutzeri]|uniref:hypothetical protein n=1 Tax=Stutzerimonas stutzeri subgroup TaxID=578833 RepID=UPI000F6F91FD|nr:MULTISPECIES: hypothetical protein [Stutzerimonas stutzeri subgroup]MCQ2046826.1 hypothetical protein [Stutzerimonas kunmingensis]QQC11860.1 hypothetical protein I6I22_03340 [Stutzerimonas stutzeri]VEI37525.1 Uncharacterised protein [Stutzerimonas stutzeri]
MVRVFIDQNIISHGVTLIGEKRQGVIGYVRKTPPPEPSPRKQFDCLPTISHLASIGSIKLGSYDELRFEELNRPRSFPYNLIGNLFHLKSLQFVKSAIDRSFFYAIPLQDYATTTALIEFCDWLTTPGLEKEILASEIIQDFPESMLENIKNLERYRFLSKSLSSEQKVDAFHYWTAETNNFDYFLTMDRKFRNAMTDSKKVVSHCRIVLPSELLEKLGISELIDFEFEEGVFYGIGGNKLYL